VSDKLLDISIRHSLQTASGILPMDIVFSAPKGSITAITGPSGAGKTTLLRQISGLITPDSGKIRFGNDVWLNTSVNFSISPQHRSIGFVFQDYALFPHLSVRENLLFALEKNSDKKIVDDLLNAVELTQLSERKPHQLSGGQQQRAALARALVRKPDLMLLDEPLAALDHHMRRRLQEYLLNLQQEHGFTMIIVTHDLGEIFRMAHQVIVIENGQIINQGTPSEVYLPKHQTDEQLVLFGEVLTCTVFDNHLLVTALIQQAVRTIKLPLQWQPDMSPGRAFALRYSLDIPEIELIK